MSMQMIPCNGVVVIKKMKKKVYIYTYRTTIYKFSKNFLSYQSQLIFQKTGKYCDATYKLVFVCMNSLSNFGLWTEQ